MFALGQPELEITKLDDGKELAFTAEVDVRPKFDLPELAGLPVTVDSAVVTPDEVEEYIGGLRERFASLKTADRPVEDGDYTSIDLSASVDGEPVEDAQASGLSYEVGSGTLLDGLDEALLGMSAGESKTFSTELAGGEHGWRAGRRDRHRAQRQDQGTARAGRRVRPVGQRVRHAGRAARRDPHPAGGGQADAAGPAGPGPGAGRGAGQGRHPAAGCPGAERDRRPAGEPGRAAGAGWHHPRGLPAVLRADRAAAGSRHGRGRPEVGQGRVRAGPAGRRTRI